MRSRQLQTALTEFVEAAAGHLQAEIVGGAEVPFELEPATGRARRGRRALYCYRALTGEFIAEREPELAAPAQLRARRRARWRTSTASTATWRAIGAERRLRRMTAHARARRGAARCCWRTCSASRPTSSCAPSALPAALERARAGSSARGRERERGDARRDAARADDRLGELALTRGLTIAQPEALAGCPRRAGAMPRRTADGADEHLSSCSPPTRTTRASAIARGREVLQDLLRALRLFGDGRVTLGALAWARVGGGAWNPLALGAGGRPHGMLVVTAEQEDELRAFCNLVSRRAPDGNELAWALQALRARLRAREPARGAERPSAGAARAAGARGPGERAARRAARRAVRDAGERARADRARASRRWRSSARGSRARPAQQRRRARRSRGTSPTTCARCCATSSAATSPRTSRRSPTSCCGPRCRGGRAARGGRCRAGASWRTEQPLDRLLAAGAARAERSRQSNRCSAMRARPRRSWTSSSSCGTTIGLALAPARRDSRAIVSRSRRASTSKSARLAADARCQAIAQLAARAAPRPPRRECPPRPSQCGRG